MYSASAYVKTQVSNQATWVKPYIYWYNSLGQYINAVTGDTFVTGTSDWVRVKCENKTAPAGAVHACIFFWTGAALYVGDVIWTDAHQLELGATATAWAFPGGSDVPSIQATVPVVDDIDLDLIVIDDVNVVAHIPVLDDIDVDEHVVEDLVLNNLIPVTDPIDVDVSVQETPSIVINTTVEDRIEDAADEDISVSAFIFTYEENSVETIDIGVSFVIEDNNLTAGEVVTTYILYRMVLASFELISPQTSFTLLAPHTTYDIID